MSDDEAQEIVYAFVDLVAAGKPYIGDASLLPHPRAVIRQAFSKHLGHYESLRRVSEQTFNELGYDETVRQLRTMLVHLDDWYEIEATDQDAVRRLNAVSGPPPDWALPLIAKYFGRRPRPLSAV